MLRIERVKSTLKIPQKNNRCCLLRLKGTGMYKQQSNEMRNDKKRKSSISTFIGHRRFPHDFFKGLPSACKSVMNTNNNNRVNKQWNSSDTKPAATTTITTAIQKQQHIHTDHTYYFENQTPRFNQYDDSQNLTKFTQQQMNNFVRKISTALTKKKKNNQNKVYKKNQQNKQLNIHHINNVNKQLQLSNHHRKLFLHKDNRGQFRIRMLSGAV